MDQQWDILHEHNHVSYNYMYLEAGSRVPVGVFVGKHFVAISPIHLLYPTDTYNIIVPRHGEAIGGGGT